MLRENVRDWFCMGVLSYWIRHAQAKQLVALGSHLVRYGVEMETNSCRVERVEVVTYREANEQDVVGAELQLPAQKWVA